MALTEKLTNIAVAIREKTGTENKLTLEQMATAIAGIETGGGSGGEDGVPNPIVYRSQQLESCFSLSKNIWIVQNFSDRIMTENISNCTKTFYNCLSLETIDFEINTVSNGCNFTSAFQGCNALTAINVPLLRITSTQDMFNGCYKLRYLPEMTFYNKTASYAMFSGCYSLRSIPENILKNISSSGTATWNHHLHNMVSQCWALDEIRGLNVGTGTVTSNIFTGWSFGANASSRPQRLKEFIFAMKDDGTPMKWNAKGQVIDLSNIGVCNSDGYLLNYNSGITADKKVSTSADYGRLKNDADWFTGSSAFSRYNLQSAINTINSIPDTAEYLSANGGTNTLKFNYNEGANTDGGKIGNMPEEQVAIATAKGWTVSITQQ